MSGNGDDPSVIFIGDPEKGPEFAQFGVACRFYGFRLDRLSEFGAKQQIFPEAALPQRQTILVVLHASEAAQSDNKIWRGVKAWADRFQIPIAIVGITPESDLGALAELTDVPPFKVKNAGSNCGLWVRAADPASAGYELRGLRITLGEGPVHFLELPDECAVKVLATVGESEVGSQPTLLRIDGDKGARYLLSRNESSETSPGTGWEFQRSNFGEIVPIFLLLRVAGDRRCWQPPAALANLTIDDPWLTDPYGCLSYSGLLTEMQRERFHVTIGFIPWNYDRNSSAVVELFRSNPTEFSVAIHGNNHDRYEFFRYEARRGDNQRPKPLAVQEFNIRQALVRMEAFHKLTGLDFDRVMVFPHGICPAQTLDLLKQNGFCLTSNYSNVPLGGKPPNDPAAGLRATNSSWSGFPAIRRNYPINLSDEMIAVDLFLGNPVMFMAHQDLFFDGIDAFTPYARSINIRQPAVRWMSLGDISRRLHLLRWIEENRCDVRLFSSYALVENPMPNQAEFRFYKYEPLPDRIGFVTVDAVEVSWTFEADTLCFSVPLPPKSTRLVELHYRYPEPMIATDLKRRGLRNRCLRLIAEFRDLSLSRSPVGRFLTRKYYRQGKHRLTLGGLLSRLSEFFHLQRSGTDHSGEN